jgi:hypothetical protein
MTNCILSIDVGIKNLAVCVILLHEEPEILFWDIIDISKEESVEDELCTSHTLKGKACTRKACFAKHGNRFCNIHAKSNPNLYRIVDAKYTDAFLARQPISKLIEITKQYDISYTSSKKCDIVTSIKSYIETYGFEPIKKAKAIKSNEISLIELGKNILAEFDRHFLPFMKQLTHVIIENQISPIANRMKTIQGMIAQYFIMRCQSIHIEFVSSSNKLTLKIEEQEEEDEELEINTYKHRKKQGIKICREILCNNFPSHTDFLDKHRKQDDLADSFLQGIWYITRKMKKVL